MRKLLVLSDLHVGRDCKEITGFSSPRPDPEFDQNFIKLLDHYTHGHESDWRLILGGDFIDFMEVVVAPQEGALGLRLSFEVTDEEREFGLGSESERVVVKLERTMSYHERFFVRLAAFVRAGGELVIVRGNHDVEMFWPKVQRVLRRRLADIAFHGEHLEVDEAIDTRNAFQDRIEFVPWFYYEPGRFYFEHGHQYDPYCSFDHWLYPLSPRNPRRIDTPVSLFAMRYFVNLMHDFSPHSVDVWSTKDYLRWLYQKGAGGLLYTARMAIGAVFRLLEYGVRWSVGRVGQYAREHQDRLRELSKKSGVPLHTLKILDHLHAIPVSRNLPELMRLLYLDRIALALGTLILASVVLLVMDSLWMELVGLALVAAATWRVDALLAPRRFLLPGPKQVQIAKRIAQLLRVPVVAMGHSHVRRAVDLGRGRLYFNTGCWLPKESKHDRPVENYLSHLVVDGAGKAGLFLLHERTGTVHPYVEGESVAQPEADSGLAPA
jgi:UDP-2,3-diacylglucosamine pyrophosphatase LpxH